MVVFKDEKYSYKIIRDKAEEVLYVDDKLKGKIFKRESVKEGSKVRIDYYQVSPKGVEDLMTWATGEIRDVKKW